MPHENRSRSIICWLLAFFLTVIGAHCWLVWLYGSALPFWDQWDEALSLFKPWREGHLTWGNLAWPASDHRIILTHLWDVGATWLNGRWDPLLLMTLDAFVHAGYACGLAFGLWYFLGRKNVWLVCGLLLPFFALPFAGENAIWGLNSLWYFIMFFSLAAIAGLGFSRVGSWPWWIGVVAALLGLLSMALGPVAPLAVGGVMGLRAIKNRRLSREGLISWGVCGVLIGLGLMLTVRAEGYRPLQAHSFAEFSAALVRHLDWPFYRWPIMAVVILIPLALLLAVYFRADFHAPRAAEWLLTLALWSLMGTSILAFGRANYGEIIPASRYTEVFSLLLITSIFSTLLLGEYWHSRFPKWNVLLSPLLYAGVIYWGLTQMSGIVVDNLLVPTRLMNVIAEERVANYLANGKENDFLDRPTVGPDPVRALAILRDPELQPILPVLCVAPGTANPGWLATASRCLLQHSVAVTAAGLLWFTALCGWGLARNTMDLSWKQPAGLLVLLLGLAALGFVGARHSLRRETIEFDLNSQLAAQFSAAGRPDRAAIHAHKADELKAFK